MKSCVIVFPGSNRDADMLSALKITTGYEPQKVWYQEADLPHCDLVVLPGGFSYGDYLRAGAIASRAPILGAVAAHAHKGGRVLGVCNGFQILTEAGLLPGVLLRNKNQKFICKISYLRVERTDTDFTHHYQRAQIIRCPVAHHDGNFYINAELRQKIEDDGQVLFRYCDAAGTVSHQTNLNGSINNIAGITNDKGTILGMMPHPENLVEPAHMGTDGKGLFTSLLEAVA